MTEMEGNDPGEDEAAHAKACADDELFVVTVPERSRAVIGARPV